MGTGGLYGSHVICSIVDSVCVHVCMHVCVLLCLICMNLFCSLTTSEAVANARTHAHTHAHTRKKYIIVAYPFHPLMHFHSLCNLPKKKKRACVCIACFHSYRSRHVKDQYSLLILIVLKNTILTYGNGTTFVAKSLIIQPNICSIYVINSWMHGYMA